MPSTFLELKSWMNWFTAFCTGTVGRVLEEEELWVEVEGDEPRARSTYAPATATMTTNAIGIASLDIPLLPRLSCMQKTERALYLRLLLLSGSARTATRLGLRARRAQAVSLSQVSPDREHDGNCGEPGEKASGVEVVKADLP